MKKKFLLLIGMTLAGLFPVYGQTTSKLDASLQIALQQHQKKTRSISSSPDTLISVTICCTDNQTVLNKLEQLGIEAHDIADGIVTAYLPGKAANQLAAMPEVTSVNAGQPASISMDQAIIHTGINKVDAGTGLETPFRGKGVVVGIIDQGHFYNHPTLYDQQGQTRIKAVWDHYNRKDPVTDPEEISRLDNDSMYANHGLHVTGIAAGSKVSGLPYFGNASEADLVLVSSSLDNSEILEEARYIQDYAEKNGQPCVINMSFGSATGPHDGSMAIDQGLDKLSGAGKLFVGAAGNEGNSYLHAQNIQGDRDGMFRILFKMPKGNFYLIQCWNSTSATLPISYYIFDPATEEATPIPTGTLNSACYISGGVDANNNKFQTTVVLICDELKKAMNATEDQLFCMEVKAEKGTTQHFWMNQANIITAGPNDKYLIPDNNYSLNDVGASASRTLCIGSFNNRTTWPNLKGTTSQNDEFGKAGDISPFSPYGPQIGNDLPKPLICAPGALVGSSYGILNPDSNPKDNLDICGEITFNGEKFYYGIMSGTSMASPQVCGIIACWLQAYPKLTPEEAVEIIQYTAKHDTYTGSLTQWDNQWGYGKIDAYAGLKECISRAHTVGINSPLNDSEAFTLLKSEKGWRILFNRPESHAVLTLTTLNGTTIENRKIAELPAAHEESITFSNLPHGVYILTVRTDRSSLSRKIAF